VHYIIFAVVINRVPFLFLSASLPTAF